MKIHGRTVLRLLATLGYHIIWGHSVNVRLLGRNPKAQRTKNPNASTTSTKQQITAVK
jgi:hypothetical protein